MREHDRCASPPQPVLLEAEAAKDLRCRGERVERAEDVVDESGLDELGGTNCAAGLRRRLEHHDVPAAVDQQVGRDQSVRPRTYDDGVGHRARRDRGSAPPVA